jgi:hypothetical protein
MIEFNENIMTELKQITSSDYMRKFNGITLLIKEASKSIERFIDRWKEDDERICNTINAINEYYGFYSSTLSNSSPSSYNRDCKYIMDSLATANLVLKSKLKKLNEYTHE